ncbi:MAG: EAL domain-containing protein [Gammaproteobacteria bacterium]|nr:MAG: EAL domain-containing protein [Gammaproteobacteria bacterium]
MNIDRELLKLNILVVDDQQINHDCINDILFSQGFEQVINVTDPRKAVGVYRTLSPALLIIDLQMPFQNGVDLFNEILSISGGHMPIVLGIAQRDEIDIVEIALKAGFSDIIYKPFDRIEVLLRVKTLLTISSLSSKLSSCTNNKNQYAKKTLEFASPESDERDLFEEKLLHMAMHDPRTNFPNRMMLQHKIGELIEVENKERFYVFVVYLNHFDDINHSLGYHNGDKILMQVAVRLGDLANLIKGAIRIDNTGGNEDYLSVMEGVNFAFLVEGSATEEEVHKIAQSVLADMQRPFDYHGMSLDIGALIGVSEYPEHGKNSNMLMQHAHIAMEMAHNSTEHYAIYSSGEDPYSARRLMLMVELRAAIENSNLKLYYQPQMSLLSEEVVGVEALIRWIHPKLGFIPPDEFIPIAEQTGLIKQLTRWVLKEAIKTCYYYFEKDEPIRVSVNISPKNIQEPDIGKFIVGALADYSLPNDLLMLELTENINFASNGIAKNNLEYLDSKHIKFSVDDFGTGYSSLSYLKQLPLTELKIDRSFVMDMMNNPDDIMIVHTTIEMGHNLGLEIVAEGVEDHTCWAMLRDLGCDTVQGYYLAKPMPEEDLEQWLANGGVLD